LSTTPVVLSIIVAFLTLVSVIVAILQYRSQHGERIVQMNGHDIELNLQRPVPEEEDAVVAPPMQVYPPSLSIPSG
jgi:hypothetical protein